MTGEKRAISITIPSFAGGLSGKLISGDIVSVIAVDYKEKGETVVPEELQYVEVIAVTDKKGNDDETVTVKPDGDTVMNEYSSKIIVGSGKLHINRDLKFENISNANNYVGGLEMTDSKGDVYVGRNIEILSRTSGTLSAGKIELCGNIRACSH